MGLRLRLHWFDKKTELGIDHEYSSDLGDNNSLLERLGISVANNMNNGDFDIETHWIPLIQPLFYQWINSEDYDYQLAFEYKANWNSIDNSKKGHNMMTEQYISIDELVGIPFPYPLAEPPKGWFACHGQAFDKEKYPKLAKCYPDGKLPDLQGEFIRGLDLSGKVDLGRTILSKQGDASRKITGKWNGGVKNSQWTSGSVSFRKDQIFSEGKLTTQDTAFNNGDGPTQAWDAYELDSSLEVPTANENRPRNIAFNYIVKAA